MRLRFQNKPWDLYAALGYMLLMTGFLLVLRADNFLLILLVLFVPGYVLVAALFPSSMGMSWTERLVLSLGLGIAVVPLLGLALNLTPNGGFAPFITATAVFTALVGSGAWWRRMALPTGERLSAEAELAIPAWKEFGLLNKTVTLTLTASVVVALGALAFIIAGPGPGERFTEFYILASDGNATDYPTRLNVSQPGTLLIGISNHETVSLNYSVRVDLVGVQVVYNATAHANETLELNRTTWSWLNVTLRDSQAWTQPYTFRITGTGVWKVQFLLFKHDGISSAPLELDIIIRVT